MKYGKAFFFAGLLLGLFALLIPCGGVVMAASAGEGDISAESAAMEGSDTAESGDRFPEEVSPEEAEEAHDAPEASPDALTPDSEEEEENGEPVVISAGEASANDLLQDPEQEFAGYVESLFGTPEEHHKGEPGLRSSLLRSNRITRGSRLSSLASPQIADLYERLLPGIKAIAAGEREESLFTFSFTELGLSDLRGYAVQEEGETTAQARKRAYENDLKLQYTYDKTNAGAALSNARFLLSALTEDLPYELYWFDKTVSMLILPSERLGYMGGVTSDGRVYARYVTLNQENREDKENPPYLRVYLWASRDYATDELESVTYTSSDGTKTVSAHLRLDPEKTGAAARALANAKKVLTEGAEKNSDAAKLTFFREYILNAVSYNHTAWSASYEGGYGDPWQLIYVFDEDPSTNVVCEGYSKAFQYLVDNTDFDDSSLFSNLMTGYLNNTGESNNHMWNLVHIDGLNFFVDLTNDDAGTNAAPRGYFLFGAVSAEDADGAWLKASPPGLSARYQLHPRILAIFTAEELALSPVSYAVHEWEAVTEDGEPVRRWNPEKLCCEEYLRCAICGETKWEKMDPQPVTQRIVPLWQTKTLDLSRGMETASLTWKTLPAYADPAVSWTSMTPDLASVSMAEEILTITPIANGTALIRGKTASGVECYVNLTIKGMKPVTGIRLYTLSDGKWKTGNIKVDLADRAEGEDELSGYLSLGLLPANATAPDQSSVEWTTSNEAVCSISDTTEGLPALSGAAPGGTRLLLMGEPGIATITAKYQHHLKVQVTVTVLNSATGLRLTRMDRDDEDIVLYPGESIRLKAMPVPLPTTDANAVSFVSGNAKVAKVNAGGLVTAVSAGDTTITAKLKNGRGKLLTESIAVSVQKPEEIEVMKDGSFKLTLNKTSVSLNYYDYSHLADREDEAESFVLTATVPKNRADLGIEWGVLSDLPDFLDGDFADAGEDFESTGKSSYRVTPKGSAGVGYVYASVGNNTALCRVEVKKPATGLLLLDGEGEEAGDMTLSYGEYRALQMALLPEDTTDTRTPVLKSTKSGVKAYGGRGIRGAALTMNARGTDEPSAVYASMGALESPRISVSVLDNPCTIVLSKSRLTMKAGTSAGLSASLLPALFEKGVKNNITWTIGEGISGEDTGLSFSSDAAGASVKLNAQAAAGGSLVPVTASLEAGGRTISAVCMVTITKPVTGIKLLLNGEEIKGETVSLNRADAEIPLPCVLADPEDATNCTAPVWTSSNARLLAIDPEGGRAYIPLGSDKTGTVKLTAKCGGKTAYFQVMIR